MIDSVRVQSGGACCSLPESRVDQRVDNTLLVIVDRCGPVRLSFFGDVGMNRVEDPDQASENGFASLLDLTASKLETIQQRVEAKGYRDVAAALDAGIDLAEALGAETAVFGKIFQPLRRPPFSSKKYFSQTLAVDFPPEVRRRGKCPRKCREA